MENIQLTEEQSNCVDFAENRDLIIQGVAGSGKSLVIVKRAIKFSKKAKQAGKPVKIAVFTFVNSLMNYTSEVISLAGAEEAADIHVSTLDKAILQLYRQVVGKYVGKIYDDKAQEACLRKAVMETPKPSEASRQKFLSDERQDWLKDEIDWIQEHMFTNEDQYLNCVRKGRGRIQLRREDRGFIFEIYRRYTKQLEKAKVRTLAMLCAEIYANRDKITDEMRYDMVLIDEAQDLSLNKLKMAQLLSRGSVTIAADFAQKIYTTGFTWKEIGLDIKGKGSQKLKGTFRNTRQIALLAASLRNHNTEEWDEDDITELEIPDRDGPMPSLIYCKTLEQQEYDFTRIVKEILLKSPKATLGILYKDWRAATPLKKWLKNAGIPFEAITREAGNVLTPGVKIVTYHSAKGLEFDYVILPLLDAECFPGADVDETSEEAIEDRMNLARNLLYVGMTRARHMLYMLAPSDVTGTPSPLLKELDPEKMNVVKS